MSFNRARHSALRSLFCTVGQTRLKPSLPVIVALIGMAPGATLTALADAPLARRAETVPAKPPMAVSWKFTSLPFAYNPAAPVIADGTLYYSAGFRLHAIDPTTGREKWRYPQDNLMATPILATPTVINGAIYFSAGDGLYALDAATGKQKWPAYSVKAGVVTTPIAIGTSIYFGGGDRKLYALDAEKGEPTGGVWSSKGRIGLDAGGDFAGDIATNGDLIYYATTDGALRGINLNTGVAKWAQRVNTTSRNMTPIVSGEFVYVAAGDTIYSYRTSNGTSRGNTRMGSESSAPPAIDADGNVYAINSDRYIVAVDSRGRSLWRAGFPRVDHEVVAAPVISGDALIVGTASGGVFAYDKATGKLIWNYDVQPSSLRSDAIPTTTNVTSQPIVYNGSLFVLTDDGTLTSFRADAGDALPPVVTPISPEVGDYLKGTPPFYIAAKIVDEGSGVDYSSLVLKLDDNPIPRRPETDMFAEKPGYTIEKDTGFLEYVLFDNGGKNATLRDGHHTVSLTARDWSGNLITKTWTFAIDDTLKKRSVRPGSTDGTKPGTSVGAGGSPGTGGPGGATGRGSRGGGGGKSGGGAGGD